MELLNVFLIVLLGVSLASSQRATTSAKRTSNAKKVPKSLDEFGSPQEIPDMCPETENKFSIPYFEDPYDCNCYYVCDQWRRPMRMCCHENLWWHPISQTCYYKDQFPKSRQEECQLRKQAALMAMEEGSYTFMPGWLKEKLNNYRSELDKMKKTSGMNDNNNNNNNKEPSSANIKPSLNEIPPSQPPSTTTPEPVTTTSTFSTAGPSNLELEGSFDDIVDENLGYQYRATGFGKSSSSSANQGIQIFELPKDNPVMYIAEPDNEYDLSDQQEVRGNPEEGSKQGPEEDMELSMNNDVLEERFGMFDGNYGVKPEQSSNPRQITIRVDFPDDDEQDNIPRQPSYTQVFQTHAANQPSPPWMINNNPAQIQNGNPSNQYNHNVQQNSNPADQQQERNAFKMADEISQTSKFSNVQANPQRFSLRRETIAESLPEQSVADQYSSVFRPTEAQTKRQRFEEFKRMFKQRKPQNQEFDIQQHMLPERYQGRAQQQQAVLQGQNPTGQYGPGKPLAQPQSPTLIPGAIPEYLNSNYRPPQIQRAQQQPQRPPVQPQPQRPQIQPRPPTQPPPPTIMEQYFNNRRYNAPVPPPQPKSPQSQAPARNVAQNFQTQKAPTPLVMPQRPPQQQGPPPQAMDMPSMLPPSTYQNQNLPPLQPTAQQSASTQNAKNLPSEQYQPQRPASVGPKINQVQGVGQYGMVPQTPGPSGPAFSQQEEEDARPSSWPVDVSLKDVKSLEQSYANYYINQAFDRSGEAGEDIAGGSNDDLLLAQKYEQSQENMIEDNEALSLDRYYANLPDEYIYGHCTVQPNPANQELKDFIWGSIDLRQSLKGGETELRINMTGFNQKDSVTQHGFHIHEYGDLSAGCQSAGSHYDPFGVVHGGPGDDPRFRHFGDLGNVTENADGEVVEVIHDLLVSLLGPFSVLGRAVVIHEKEDDLGRGQNEGSLLTGNAGARLACCTIGLSNGDRWMDQGWEYAWQTVISAQDQEDATAAKE